MGKFLYAAYALVVVSVMSTFSFSQPSPQSGQANSDRYYHGSSSGGSGYTGTGGGSGGHK
jgi:hypothetical protein